MRTAKTITPRQREIMQLVCADGMSGQETGYVLGISGQTVKNHITPLLRLLGEGSMNRVCYRYGQGEFEGEPERCPECGEITDFHAGDCLGATR